MQSQTGRGRKGNPFAATPQGPPLRQSRSSMYTSSSSPTERNAISPNPKSPTFFDSSRRRPSCAITHFCASAGGTARRRSASSLTSSIRALRGTLTAVVGPMGSRRTARVMRSSSAQAGEAGETAGGAPTSVRVRTTGPLGLSARGLKIGVPPLSDDYGDPGAGVGDLDVRVGGDVPVDSVVADPRITEARLVRVDGLPVHVAPGGGADLAGNVAEHVPSGGVGVVGPNVDPLVDDVAVARGVRVEVAPLVAVRVAAVPDVLDGGFVGPRLPCPS